MKVIRGTQHEIMTTHRQVWEHSREDVFCAWSESDLQETQICTCGQTHIDLGWTAEEYLRVAFQLLLEILRPVDAIHISPHRFDDLEALADRLDPGRPPHTLWGAQIKRNPDIGSEKIRVRSPNKAGTPLREIEFSIPW